MRADRTRCLAAMWTHGCEMRSTRLVAGFGDTFNGFAQRSATGRNSEGGPPYVPCVRRRTLAVMAVGSHPETRTLTPADSVHVLHISNW